MGRFSIRPGSPLIAAAAILALSAQLRAQAPAAPPAAPAPAPQAPQSPPTAPPAARADTSRSLFAPYDNGVQISGRLSSESGDPARWQRYQDFGDGLLLTGGRLLRETPEWNAT